MLETYIHVDTAVVVVKGNLVIFSLTACNTAVVPAPS